ncbi:reverse transcriptase/maturase family protein [bacterium]|nr:reverse transcriptase/maturase family protein [bacterium]MBU1957381.1 reverse transcriptase/maturase family protein [bacterium]
MFSFQNIYKAYMACRKTKRNTFNQLLFERDLITNLWNLQYELSTYNYKIGRSLCFLTSSPKLREVFAADFRDRVVHHILVNELEPLFERKFIHDVYNNRQKRGTHQAVKQAKRYMNQTLKGYYLQLDIKGFFYNLNKMILFDKIKKEVIGSDLDVSSVLYLTNKILFHDPTRDYHFKGDRSKLTLLPEHKTLFKIPKSRGLPIGNLTSQFFANVYMNDFDNFVKRKLKVKRYIRYVDDFVLFDERKERLAMLKVEIENYLSTELHLTLREDSKLKRHSEGLDFLGYIIRPNYTLVRQRVVNNFKKKKATYLRNYESQKGKMSREEIKNFLSVQASFVSHNKHANSFNLMNKVGKLDENNPFDYDRT